MGWTEVAGCEGVGRGVMGLLRLWKGVEKVKTPTRKPGVMGHPSFH